MSEDEPRIFLDVLDKSFKLPPWSNLPSSLIWNFSFVRQLFILGESMDANVIRDKSLRTRSKGIMIKKLP